MKKRYFWEKSLAMCDPDNSPLQVRMEDDNTRIVLI